MIIEIFKEDDRLAVAAILVKNGYTVRQFKRKDDNKRSYKYYIEFTRKEQGNEQEHTET